MTNGAVLPVCLLSLSVTVVSLGAAQAPRHPTNNTSSTFLPTVCASHPAHHPSPARLSHFFGLQEIRDQLTSMGHEEAVWELANRRPAAKKSDWVTLMRNTAGVTAQ